MSLETIIASPSNDYSLIITMTDSYIPACNIWIGDYPYLNKKKFIKSISKPFAKRYNNNDNYEDNDTYNDDNNDNNENANNNEETKTNKKITSVDVLKNNSIQQVKIVDSVKR